MAKIDVTITRMQDDIKHTSETVDRVEKKLDAFIAASQSAYAAKWTERAMKWLILTLATLILTYAFFKFVGAPLKMPTF